MPRAGKRTKRQVEFEFRTWGGPRAGAGPKSTRERPALPHRTREEFQPYQPIHVTARVASHVWNLRSQRAFAVFHAAVDAVRGQSDLRVTHFSVQGNHFHLIVEAESKDALSHGVRTVFIRIARGLNRMMGRRGPVLEDRYHMHVLRTPAEVRNAIRYVEGNFESHAARRGERVSGRWVDPFSSAANTVPRKGQGVLFPEPITSEPRTWLLRNAWGRAETRRPEVPGTEECIPVRERASA